MASSPHRLVLVVFVAVALTARVASAADERIIEAAKSRDARATQALVQQHVDVNVAAGDGATALHWAAHWDDVDTASRLIRAGARPGVSNVYGVTPLYLASVNGSRRMVEVLVSAGAAVNAAVKTGETPLMAASRTGNLEVIRALLAAGADLNRKELTKGQTALMWAAAEGHAEAVQTLVEGGAAVDARSTTGYSALLYAARAGSLQTVRALMAAGANVNHTAADGLTALLMATVRGHVPVAVALLDSGANPNINAAGYTSMHWAAGTWETTLRFTDEAQQNEWTRMMGIKGDAKLAFIKRLLAAGADPNIRITKNPPQIGLTAGLDAPYLIDFKGATPLVIAARAADAPAMRLLLAAGADPRTATDNKTTPLIQAAGLSRMMREMFVTEAEALEAVTLAVATGDDVNAASAQGETALHAAAFRGYDSVVEFLVAHGANLNAQNKVGDTPWMIAAGKGARRGGTTILHERTARLLVRLGAEETVSDGRHLSHRTLDEPPK